MSIQNQISSTIEQIRNNPLNQNLRLSLIQYYCIAGQWDNASKLLKQYLKLNPNDQQTQALFLGNLACEQTRLKVCSGELTASAFAKEDENIPLQRQLLAQISEPETLNETFLQLHEQVAPSLTIELNNQSTIKGELVDTDVRFSHIVEIYEESRYSWLSLADIKTLKFKPTEILTDLIWRRAEIVLKNEQHIACFIPVRYPFDGSESVDESLLYAKSTLWTNVGDFSVAQGQKTYTTADDVDIGILDITQLYSV